MDAKKTKFFKVRYELWRGEAEIEIFEARVYYLQDQKEEML